MSLRVESVEIMVQVTFTVNEKTDRVEEIVAVTPPSVQDLEEARKREFRELYEIY